MKPKIVNTEVFLVDFQENVLGIIFVEEKYELLDKYWGKLIVNELPENIKEIFHEYENLVNSQTLSLLDPIELEIERLNLGISLPTQKRFIAIKNLQIMSYGVYFKIPSDTEYPGS